MPDVKVNDVIQIVPEHDWGGGCLAVVTEIKVYGCQAVVNVPGRGFAYVHLNNGDYAVIGEAAYVPH